MAASSAIVTVWSRRPSDSPVQKSVTRAAPWQARRAASIGASRQLNRHSIRRSCRVDRAHTQLLVVEHCRRRRLAAAASSAWPSAARESSSGRRPTAACRRWRRSPSRGTGIRAPAVRRSRQIASGSFHHSRPFCQLRSRFCCAVVLMRSHVRLMSLELREPWIKPADGQIGWLQPRRKAVAGAAADGLHATPIGFDASGTRIRGSDRRESRPRSLRPA